MTTELEEAVVEETVVEESEAVESEVAETEDDDDILEFHGEKCCWFKKRDKYLIRFSLDIVKNYGREDTTSYGDHVYYMLRKCPDCGAYFLVEEVEQINWSGGDDSLTVNYYQVDSPEQADKLVEIGEPFWNYKGPRILP